VLALLATTASPAFAQTPRPVREAFVVETDDTAPKKLGAFDDYVAQKSWDAAISLLRDVSASKPGSLIRVSPERSMSLVRYCDVLLTQLPPEGLATYRRSVDAQAATWLAEADATHDERALRLIVERAFASSVGDDAIDRLASRAWERGDLQLARELWALLVPLQNTARDDPPLAVLRYPDTDLSLARIRAKLILCDVALGNRSRGTAELAAFRVLHPNESGHIAGQEGRFADILSGIQRVSTEQSGEQRNGWDVPPRIDGTTTFGTTAARAGFVPFEASSAGAIWSRELPNSDYATSVGRPALPARDPLSYYPVVWHDKVFVADATRVFGFELDSGRAAWSISDEDAGILYPPPSDIGSLGEPRPYDASALSGVPQHTLTVANDRLYGRLGLPPTSWPARELRRAESSIVCLDLKREGLPLWSVSSEALGSPEEWWSFEGPPVSDHGRLFVLANRSRPLARLHALCLDAATGEVLWNVPVGSPIASPPEGLAVMTHRLITYAAGRLFVQTNRGAVICLDADDGRAQWVGWYDSRPVREGLAANAPERNLPAACLCDSGVLVAAPADSDRIFAFDAASGVPLWDVAVRGGARQPVGAHDGVLVVSGQRLLGLNLDSGKQLWTVGFEDPPGFGAGRGLLAGEFAYWPTREDLFVVHIASGTPTRRFPIKKALNLAGGGNLALSKSRLLFAGSDRIVAFRE
jgi:outer membrane protein assembly factor BamB